MWRPQGHWGRALRDYMSDYVHWSCLGAFASSCRSGEPGDAGAGKGRHGLPVAHFSYSQCDNDRALMKAAQSVMEDILHAAGADEVITINRYAHLVGGADGGRRAARRGGRRLPHVRRAHLYITDGSVLPTQGGANPALTIMAVAARAADRLAGKPVR